MKPFIIYIFIMVCVDRLAHAWGSRGNLHADRVPTLSRKNIFSPTHTNGEGTLRHIGERIKHLEGTINELFTKIAETQNICLRRGDSLRCCADDLSRNNVCVEFGLTLSNFTAKVVFEVNNTTVIDEEISEQEPDPLCGALPHLHIIKFCFEPYNLAYADETLNVCLAISGRIGVIPIDISRVDLNCFMFSRDGKIRHVQPTTNATNTGIINFTAP